MSLGYDDVGIKGNIEKVSYGGQLLRETTRPDQQHEACKGGPLDMRGQGGLQYEELPGLGHVIQESGTICFKCPDGLKAGVRSVQGQKQKRKIGTVGFQPRGRKARPVSFQPRGRKAWSISFQPRGRTLEYSLLKFISEVIKCWSIFEITDSP